MTTSEANTEIDLERVWNSINYGWVDVFKEQIDAGVSVDTLTPEGIPIVAALLYNDSQSHGVAKVEMFQYLIGRGAKLDYEDENGWTLLFFAAKNDFDSVFKVLVERGLDLKHRDNNDKICLFHTNDGEIIKFAIETDKSLADERDRFGNSLLHKAAASDFGNESLVKWLTQYIDVNVKSVNGNTALLSALTGPLLFAHIEDNAYTLLEAGADPNVRNNSGNTIVAKSISDADLGFIKALAKAGADFESPDKRGWYPIHYAVNRDNKELVEFLVDQGVDYKQATDNGDTVLSLAVNNSNMTLIEYFLARDVDVNAKTKQGKTALNFAIDQDNVKIETLLREKGGEAASQAEQDAIFKRNQEEKTKEPIKVVDLESAIDSHKLAEFEYYLEKEKYHPGDERIGDVITDVVSSGTLDMLRALIKRGVSITSEEDELRLLHRAVASDQVDIARYLIDAGWDVNGVTEKGKSVYRLSARSSLEMIKLLESSGVKLDKSLDDNIVYSALWFFNPELASHFEEKGFPFKESYLQDAKLVSRLIQYQREGSVEYMLNKGLNIEQKVELYGRDVSLLTFAVMLHSEIMSKFLLARGANPNADDFDGLSLTRMAIQEGDAEIAIALFEQGANIELTNNNEEFIPLLLALQEREIAVANYLIDKGVSLEAYDSKLGYNALHFAVRFGYMRTLKQMIDSGADVSTKTKDGKTPYEIAMEYGHEEIGAYLKGVPKNGLFASMRRWMVFGRSH